MCKVPPLTPRAATIVVGFSVRGLAEATAAATVPPLAVDHFADHDCRQAAEQVVRIKQWRGNVSHNAELLNELLHAGAGPHSCVLLAGGMENWPELVEFLQHHFRLLGPTGDQLRLLRSPACWRRWCQQSRMAFPETRFPQAPGQPNQPPSKWLIKPLRGAGGHSIRWSSSFASGSHGLSSTARSSDWADTYWQCHVAGRPLGAYCVLHRDGSVEWLGATESISAGQWPGPSEFIYRGSLGPIDLAPHHRRQILDLCQLIHRQTGMLGWLQLDFIEDQAGELWLLELNPRWAAGMEVLYLAGINPVEHHRRAWQSETASAESPLADGTPPGTNLASADTAGGAARPPGSPQHSCGKAIVYAPRELQLTHQHIDLLQSLPRDNFADLPSHQLIADGQTSRLLSTGEPLLTVRARGPHDTLIPQLAELRETALAALARV